MSKRSELKRTSAVKVKIEQPSSPVSVEELENDPEYEEDVEAEEEFDDEEIDATPVPPRKRIKKEIQDEDIKTERSRGEYRHPRKFNDKWLTIPEVRAWIHPLKMDPRYVWCKYCKIKIRAHLSDMKVHSKTKKHNRNMGNTRPEVPAELPNELVDDAANNILITFPSQKDNSQEVIVVPVHQEEASSPSSKELIIPASIGFIGCGNMAQALMNAFLGKGLVEANLMMASAPSNRNLVKMPSGMRTTNDNNRVVKECDIIFICVKPHLLSEMIESLDPLERDHNPLFISVVTGFDLSTLEQLLGSLIDAPRVVRTMPNTPCMIGLGCCVYALGNNTNESDTKVVQSMLSAIGFCAKVPEYQIDAACGLAGSGPAYIYAAIEALADGGVKMGLPRQLSQSLAAHMVKGAAAMVLETGKHPGQLKDEVCSPSGTTITAMHTLEKNGFRNSLISAVEASAKRSKELGGTICSEVSGHKD